ncbi:PAP2 superfamily-domain-containing protein [Thelonectria olida]|uniref:PAP2 superfamily-domain-containing protein n=1 Tax=Thelonectria olida TaxID=1576542 RepID=A0A9P8WCU3_9HYPO|nr:PAP2 superfamily-domain-containing protein [Thelonectria olida]
MVSSLRNVLEPAFIVAGFTAGCLINRRRGGQALPQETLEDDLESGERYTDASPPLKPTVLHSEIPIRKAPNLFFRLLSRFFNAYPFLIEIWYWNMTYWIYQGLRAVSARAIAGNEAVFNKARDHAISILSVEGALGIDIERRFQSYIMNDQPWLMPLLANIYYSHISLGICFLVYIYTFLPPSTFQRIRRTIAADNAIAFVIVTFWRCSPPRLLPQEYGFVDVLHGKTANGGAWNNNRFQLTIAAMPSLHFGTALFFCVCMVRFSPHKVMRILAPLWPAAMLITIVATANHFLMDAMIGAMVPFLGWRINQVVLILKPLQDWVFAPLINRLDLVDPSSRSVPKTL